MSLLGRYVRGLHHGFGRQPVTSAGGAAALAACRDAQQEGEAAGQATEPEPHLQAGATCAGQLLPAP